MSFTTETAVKRSRHLKRSRYYRETQPQYKQQQSRNRVQHLVPPPVPESLPASPPKARLIAFYLPQYHRIAENDRWWGEGFTEWNNVRRAKPLFQGHDQPRIPTELGYYDLTDAEVRDAQAAIAQQSGIEGFCYWHYWFGNGQRLLEKPFNEVLTSQAPHYPFCLGWANHSWSRKTWNLANANDTSMLMEQKYPGKEDHIRHFYELLPAFEDKRYIRVDGKPLMTVFDPFGIPEVEKFLDLWRSLASKNGLPGIHFVGCTRSISSSVPLTNYTEIAKLLRKQPRSSAPYYSRVLNLGFDAVNSRGLTRAELMTGGILKKAALRLINNTFGGTLPDRYEYREIIKHLFSKEDRWESVYPTLLPNWDRSPRSGKKALIWHNSTPELFGKSVEDALTLVANKSEQHKIVFIRSWNEWGEGNYLEPDATHGRGYLDAIKARVFAH